MAHLAPLTSTRLRTPTQTAAGETVEPAVADGVAYAQGRSDWAEPVYAVSWPARIARNFGEARPADEKESYWVGFCARAGLLGVGDAD